MGLECSLLAGRIAQDGDTGLAANRRLWLRRRSVRGQRTAWIRRLLPLHALPAAHRCGRVGDRSCSGGRVQDRLWRGQAARVAARAWLGEVVLRPVRVGRVQPPPFGSAARRCPSRGVRPRPGCPAEASPVRCLRRTVGANSRRWAPATRGEFAHALTSRTLRQLRRARSAALGGRRAAPTLCRCRGVKSSCVQWCAGELTARAVLGSHDAPRVADTGRADQAAHDHESAGDPDAQPESID